MGKMEKSVIAEENKKQKLLEDSMKTYEEKRTRQEMQDEDKRKKAIMERQ